MDAKPQALSSRVSAHDMAQLRSYCSGSCDFHMLLKVLPALAELFFAGGARLTTAPTLQVRSLRLACSRRRDSSISLAGGGHLVRHGLPRRRARGIGGRRLVTDPAPAHDVRPSAGDAEEAVDAISRGVGGRG